MRQPKPEEDEIVELGRLPLKDVALLIVHGARPDPDAVECQHL